MIKTRDFPSTWLVFASLAFVTVTAVACSADNTGEAADADDSSSGGTENEDSSGARSGEPPSDWPDPFTVGVLPTEGAESIIELFSSFASALEEDLGVEVQLNTATDYAGIIEAQVAGSLHMAQHGGFSYIIAQRQGAEIEPAGVMVGGPDEEPGYLAYGITRADNDEINSIEDFTGRSVCFVDPSSASGYLYPSAGLLGVGLDPEDDVEPVFAGSHDASVIGIAAGDCEAGFAYDDLYQRMIDEGLVEADELKVVWESVEIPNPLFSISTELPESFRQAVTESMVANNGDVIVERGLCADDFTVDEGPTGVPSCLITHTGGWGFVAVDDEFYDGTREVCELTEAPACAGNG